MRITKEPEERRNEILDIAENLFTTKGYSKTTVNDILEKVQIAKGTFYYYFKSKEEVMDAIVTRYIDASIKATKLIADNPNLTVQEKFFGILMGQKLESSHKGQVIDQLHQVNNVEMHQKSLVETILQLTPVLTEVIERGIKEGLFKTPYPKETIEILLTASGFLFDEGIFKWEPQELMQKIQAFIYTIEVVLGAEKGSFAYIINLFQRN